MSTIKTKGVRRFRCHLKETVPPPEIMECEKSGFKTELDVRLKPGSDGIWVLSTPLVYHSELLNDRLLGGDVVIPYGFTSENPVSFETDFASVPRIPFIYERWGDRAHREAVLHDYLYRRDSLPQISCSEANTVFLEAMKSRGVPWWIRWPMYIGVSMFGWASFHKLKVCDQLN